MKRKKNKKSIHDSRGFSLIEVLLGISIFMIGMLGVTALNISSLKSNTFSGNLSEATLIASTKIEELMATKFDNIVDTDLDGTNQDTNDDGLDNNGGNFGLDDLECPKSPVTTAEADGCDTAIGKNNIFTVYWNIAVNEPISTSPPDPVKTKIINVIVEWYVKEEPRRINMQLIRMRD